MASSFNEAFDFLIKSNVEGVLSDLKDDPGGITKYGISSKQFPNLDIPNLTKEKAKILYHKHYWDDDYDNIQNQNITNKIFLAIINMGAAKAHHILQQSLNEMGCEVEEDGIFGPQTCAAVNNVGADFLLDKYSLNLIKYYLTLDNIRVSKKQTSYLRGWVNRVLI